MDYSANAVSTADCGVDKLLLSDRYLLLCFDSMSKTVLIDRLFKSFWNLAKNKRPYVVIPREAQDLVCRCVGCLLYGFAHEVVDTAIL